MSIGERVVKHDRQVALPNQEQIVHAIAELVELFATQDRRVRVLGHQPLGECESHPALALLFDAEMARVDERLQHQHETHASVAR